ncbi:MAG: hypothetical protein V4689_15275 [Verrucomicrobiota bacterium]
MSSPPTPAAAQVVTATAEAPTGKVKLEFEKKVTWSFPKSRCPKASTTPS